MVTHDHEVIDLEVELIPGPVDRFEKQFFREYRIQQECFLIGSGGHMVDGIVDGEAAFSHTGVDGEK